MMNELAVSIVAWFIYIVLQTSASFGRILTRFVVQCAHSSLSF
jgi:hypothetical protein